LYIHISVSLYNLTIIDHETTSGLLSFLFYYLLKNPAACQAAQRQVDEVVGRGPITVEHMNKLPYIEACLRETLRLQPPAPVFTIAPYPDTKDFPVIIGGGKYAVEKGQVMVVLLQKVHRDPAVYGDDAEDFKPERMNEEKFSKLPPNSWKVSKTLL
jgi:cytochrome P450/NADPH-cytochrome P450 reductase